MKIGIKLNTQFTADQDPVRGVAELCEQVAAAREAGLHSVWVSQHYLAAPYQALQTWPLLGRIAAESGDMQIGSSIFLLTLHNPVYAAEQSATLDVISGGRFVFGIGLGYREQEFEAFGVDMKTRVGRFTEALQVLLRLWTEETVTHHGRFFSLTDAHLALKPVQEPYPPVWIAASGDRAVERAGALGFPWLVNPHASLAGIDRQTKLFHAALREHGHPAPPDFPVFKEFSVGRTHDEAVRQARPYLEGKYASYAEWGLDKPMPDEERLDREFDELARDRFVIGTPDECVAELRRHQETVGANHFLLRMQWPGMPQARVLEQIELVGKEVLPAVTNRAPTTR